MLSVSEKSGDILSHICQHISIMIILYLQYEICVSIHVFSIKLRQSHVCRLKLHIWKRSIYTVLNISANFIVVIHLKSIRKFMLPLWNQYSGYVLLHNTTVAIEMLKKALQNVSNANKLFCRRRNTNDWLFFNTHKTKSSTTKIY